MRENASGNSNQIPTVVEVLVKGRLAEISKNEIGKNEKDKKGDKGEKGDKNRSLLHPVASEGVVEVSLTLSFYLYIPFFLSLYSSLGSFLSNFLFPLFLHLFLSSTRSPPPSPWVYHRNHT